MKKGYVVKFPVRSFAIFKSGSTKYNKINPIFHTSTKKFIQTVHIFSL